MALNTHIVPTPVTPTAVNEVSLLNGGPTGGTFIESVNVDQGIGAKNFPTYRVTYPKPAANVIQYPAQLIVQPGTVIVIPWLPTRFGSSIMVRLLLLLLQLLRRIWD